MNETNIIDNELEAAKRKEKSDLLLSALGMAGQQIGGAISGVKPQTSLYEQIAATASDPIEKLQKGRDVAYNRAITEASLGQKGMFYDPKSQKFAYNPEMDIERNLKEKEFGLKKEKMQLAEAKPINLTPGQKATDVKFAGEYNEWITSGQGTYEKNKAQLQDAINQLQSDKNLSGPAISLVPERLRPKATAVKQQVQNSVNNMLRATLGAQFTEKEGERIMAQSYDDRLPPEENIKKIARTMEQLDKNKGNMENRIEHYEQKGTLAGWKAPKTNAIDVMQVPKEKRGLINSAMAIEPSNDQAEAIKWIEQNPNDPRVPMVKKKLLQMNFGKMR